MQLFGSIMDSGNTLNCSRPMTTFVIDFLSRCFAFDKIKKPGNWKGPIRATIPAEDYELAAAAVAYFTGSNLDITKNKNNQYTVYAAGYYAVIGS